jgi:hypothetical protein
LRPIALAGTLTVPVGEQSFSARFRTEKQDDRYVLVMDTKDLKRAARQYLRWDKESVTDAEVELIAGYPLRVPSLLRIADHARTEAQQAARRNPEVPEDAYRHVLWSYLLMRRFGEDFAEQVTDAHEVGDPAESAAEHKMDYHNNAIGRAYARAGHPELSIMTRVMIDRQVMREP